MKAYFKLVRLPNVLMMGITLALMRYAIIAPILAVYSMELKLPFLAFMAYVFATMLIAAAGYAINDYYDKDLDLVNRDPNDVVVGKDISPGNVLWIYRIFNILALLLGAYSSYKAGVMSLLFCYPIMIGLLYFYTTTYKKQLLVGNLIVALAISMVPVAVYLFEMPPVLHHYKYYIISGTIQLNVITGWILGFSAFAFLSGITREIIKDMEDFEGDRMVGRNTVPIAWGMNTSRWITMVLLFFIVIALVIAYYLFFIYEGSVDFITLVYFFAFLIVPLGYNIYHLWRAKTVEAYKFCGDLLKWIMLLGILYAPVVWFIIHKKFGV
jgi:4-hydroxybenzoate polyprenyltransferase